MKIKNALAVAAILVFLGLFPSETMVSQGILQQLKESPIVKNNEIATQNPSGSGVLDFRHFTFLNKKSPSLPPHSDTLISYCTQTTSIKDYSTYDIQGNTVGYRRQYLTPSGWLNSYKITSTFNGMGATLTSLLQEWKNNTWVDSSLITNTYDGSGNVITNLLQNKVNGNWVNVSLSTFAYDGSGNMISEQEQQWDISAWVNTKLYTNTFNGNNNKMSSQTQEWDGTNWNNLFFELWTYDGGNQIITYLFAHWDGANWIGSLFYTYTYDLNENVLTCLNQHSTDGFTWLNSFLNTYTYDDYGNQLTELAQMWQDPYWTNTSFTTQTYDTNGNRLTRTFQTWTGTDWGNVAHSVQTYNENRDCLTSISQVWDSDGWKNDKKSEYTYYQNRINANSYNWNGGDWVLGDGPLQVGLNNHNIPVVFFSENAPSYNVIVYYSYYPTGIKNAPVSTSSLQVYPNPAGNILNVKITLANPANGTIKILDLSGKEIVHFPVQVKSSGDGFTIDTETLLAGQYILQFNAGLTNESRNFLIVK